MTFVADSGLILAMSSNPRMSEWIAGNGAPPGLASAWDATSSPDACPAAADAACWMRAEPGLMIAEAIVGAVSLGVGPVMTLDLTWAGMAVVTLCG